MTAATETSGTVTVVESYHLGIQKPRWAYRLDHPAAHGPLRSPYRYHTPEAARTAGEEYLPFWADIVTGKEPF